jgi:hypothetical protein
MHVLAEHLLLGHVQHGPGLGRNLERVEPLEVEVGGHKHNAAAAFAGGAEPGNHHGVVDPVGVGVGQLIGA